MPLLFGLVALTSGCQGHGAEATSVTQYAKTVTKEFWFLFIDPQHVIQFLPQDSIFDSHNQRNTKAPVHRPSGNKLSHYDIQLQGKCMPVMLTTQEAAGGSLSYVCSEDTGLFIARLNISKESISKIQHLFIKFSSLYPNNTF